MSAVTRRKFYLIVLLLSLFFILEIAYLTTRLSRENLYLFSLSAYNAKKVDSSLTTGCSPPNKKQGYLISYSPSNNEEWLCGINNADYIFEYINNEGLLAYDSIFLSKDPYKPSPISSTKKISIDDIPSFAFSNSLNRIYSKNQKATYIFVTMNYNAFSNFIYDKGYYTHFKNTRTDIDAIDYKPILISNIIIQYTDNYKGIANLYESGHGKGILFSGERAIDIEWEKAGSSPIKIKDTNGNDITLLEGKTWWIILNKNCYLTYN